MITDNKLIFGFGDIGVGSNCIGLVFTQIKPPAEIGATLSKEYCEQFGIEFGKSYTMQIDINEISKLNDLLGSVTISNPIFEFNNFIFDFSKFNEGSIDVVKKYLNKLTKNYMYLMPYAC